MAIDIRCPGCGRTLRVPDEHAGRQVRCPACQQISVAPGGAVASELAGQWHLRTPDGPTYGPLSWAQLQEWAAEGRVSAGCQLSSDSDGVWRAATEFFPNLPRPKTAAPPPGPQTYPWTTEQVSDRTGGTGSGYVAPHRGGLILVLALLGFFMPCPVFSLLAWVMGSHDLAEMRAGRMDRSGEGMTQTGQVLGMILSLLCILSCVVMLAIFLIGVFAAAFS